MLTKKTCGKITWIDIESPTQSEVRMLMKEYNIHSLVANELLSPTLRPRVDIHSNHIYLILHFPAIIHTHHNRTEQEIDFIIGKNFLITAHYETIDTLHEFAKLLDVSAVLKKCDFDHAGFLFYEMIKEFYKNIEEELVSIQKELNEVENRIFKGEEHLMVTETSKLSRKLLDFKKAVRPHYDILVSFEAGGGKFFGEDFIYYLRAISGEYYKISAFLENNIEILKELRATNDSLLTTKTNDIMRILTIMAFVTFPVMLVSSIFGMNTEILPIVGLPNDFWIIIGIMFMATVGFFTFFKYKKWL